ncbi:MAG TPA: BamA/TamA family outer membrane protein [Burkholderiaceae bacterium]|nr:BamA/TamA family outer membrane protein [Burkholderiaceae bacterium]
MSSVAWAASRPEVVIDPGGVPPAALAAISGAVDAITRLAEDQDGGEVERLRRRAHDATVSALETQGYFSSVVTLEVGQDYMGETWDIIIEPGPRTAVRNVDLNFQGQVATEEFEHRVEKAREIWPLRAGETFINSQWSSAKTTLLDEINTRDFFFARITHSQATVHAEEAQADLTVEVDSGPRVRMGPMKVLGLRRVPASLIERYVRYAPGEPYDQDRLDDWQQSLQSTRFFRGAFVTLDAEGSDRRDLPNGEVELPLRVQVSEAPARRFTSSLGFDSDHGVGVEALYQQNIVAGLPVAIETGLGLNRHRQRAFFDVHLPPTHNGYQDSFGVLYEHSDIQGVDNQRYGVGWKRRQERQAAGDSRVEYETQWGLVAAHDRTRIDGAEGFTVPTLVGTWQWLRRDVDSKYDPREGHLLDVGLGAGVTLDKGEPFYRASLRAQRWWTMGERDVLTLRGQVGKVWSQTDRLPQDFGYRIGGARSVRGYKYDSIGLQRGDATYGAPAMAVASVEYIHYITEQWGVSAFIDAGDAAESFGDMDLYLGYGLGAAFVTPAGPFYMDLAWGQKDRRLRLHFSLGIAF